ncbi:hypothetical protein HMPREF0063_10711 [Aeromicrobium marinum DSM 15272]|uniref:AB hydrolase-1 domain-containing protein n=1 Tax=Aeromicrobium marinum DSM 15272 TaxID=585531 RepID=E2S9S1_9ACTN|nr:alpha/beta fold hydrolase [Aeromicrobium marinum]EFQ83995.1 hypothetical protein HMPREF0063_10711 [Aeromicrobium marinum DSM 15272]
MTPLRIDPYASPDRPRAAVLFLHGGQQENREAVEDKHASWWRIAAMTKRLRGWAEQEHLATHLLQYRERGWNDLTSPSPVRDARETLDLLAEQHVDVPVVIVGHSMGGRTACRVADHPAVVGVVGLAPWLPEDEPVGALQDRHLRVIHGSRDRWTSAPLSREFVERARPLAASASWESLPGAGHFMFRRVSTWNDFVKDSVADILSATPPRGEASHPGAGESLEGPA